MNTRLDSLFRRDPAEVQGAYFLLTGLWPLVHMRSFTWVTGPKREGWLVKTAGGLIGVIGATLLSAHRRGRTTPELRELGIWSALSLLVVDAVYAGKRRISPIYLLDAVAEAGLVAAQARALVVTQAVVHTEAHPAVELPDTSRYVSNAHGRWDILPGESRDALGQRDKVDEGSMESFPASDPTSYMG